LLQQIHIYEIPTYQQLTWKRCTLSTHQIESAGRFAPRWTSKFALVGRQSVRFDIGIMPDVVRPESLLPSPGFESDELRVYCSEAPADRHLTSS